jgi:hypothetical protein
MKKKVACDDCGRKVPDNFRAQFRHIARYHELHLIRRIVPLVFLPSDQLRQVGIDPRQVGIDLVTRFLKEVKEDRHE